MGGQAASPRRNMKRRRKRRRRSARRRLRRQSYNPNPNPNPNPEPHTQPYNSNAHPDWSLTVEGAQGPTGLPGLQWIIRRPTICILFLRRALDHGGRLMLDASNPVFVLGTG